MGNFLAYTVVGLTLGGVYAVAASGLVVTYTTTGVFNFAHGAVGMLAAFSYWQLSSDQAWGLPAPVAFAIVVLVGAPLVGAVLERAVFRGLEGTSEVTRLVVTVGLMAAMLSLAPIVWPSIENRRAGRLIEGAVEIGEVSIPWHRLLIVAIAVGVALGLRFVLFQTRSGVSMRAVVDNRELAALNGARPARAAMLSWMLGCALAAMAGVLVAERNLDVVLLTFFVINAYAAAIFGRLVNLPRTFVGAVVLGLLESYATGYLPDDPSWVPDDIQIADPLSLAIPVLVLFGVLLALPSAPLRGHGLGRLREQVVEPTWRSTAIGCVVLVGGVAVVSGMLDAADSISWGKGLAYGVIMLSLVPLTGYGGQISLAQMSFAGLGGYAVARWGVGGNPLSLVAAVGLAGAVGAIVALPALRLRGIYLALATLAFAFLMDKVVFIQEAMFPAGTRSVDRFQLGPVDLEDDRAYLVFMAVVLAAVACVVVAVRRGPLGRRLLAMKDSPAACATLGLNLTVAKLQVFMLSAAIAGLGGALLAGLGENASPSTFETLQGLPILLMAVAGGIAMVSGAVLGGLMLASFPVVSEAVPALSNPLLLAPGLLGVSLARNPNGLAAQIGGRLRRLTGGRTVAAGDDVDEPSPLLPGLEPARDIEGLGVDRPFTAEEMAEIDALLGIDDTIVELCRPPVADPVGRPG